MQNICRILFTSPSMCLTIAMNALCVSEPELFEELNSTMKIKAFTVSNYSMFTWEVGMIMLWIFSILAIYFLHRYLDPMFRLKVSNRIPCCPPIWNSEQKVWLPYIRDPSQTTLTGFSAFLSPPLRPIVDMFITQTYGCVHLLIALSKGTLIGH